MADSIRGNGLITAHESLSALVNNPERLAHARQRFDESPPPYRSQSSDHSTLLESPTPPSEIQRQRSRAEKIYQLMSEHNKSHPACKFRAELSAEDARIQERIERRLYDVPVGVSLNSIAFETVKKRWIQHGIWSDNWTLVGGMPCGSSKWKHEEPLEQESEWEADPDAEHPVLPGRLFGARTPKPRRLKSDEERQRIAERRPIREREREASRPFHRFVEQISREREWLQDISRQDGTDIADSPDINTVAYTAVKNEWIEKGLWHSKWGVLPGMAWKHEQPLEEFLRDEMGDEPEEVDTEATEPVAAPMPNLFAGVLSVQANRVHMSSLPENIEQAPDGSLSSTLDGQRIGSAIPAPIRHLGGSSAAGSISSPGVADTSSRDGPADAPSVEHPYEDAQHARPMSDSQHGRGDGHATATLGSTHGAPLQRPEPSLSPTPRPSGLDQRRPSKVSKGRGNNQVGARRRGRPRRSEQPSEARESQTAPDVSEGPPENSPTPPRRSARLDDARSSRGTNPSATSVKEPAKTRPLRKGATLTPSRDKAKPQGVQKRRAARRQ